ncbi:MAG: polysaccharide deacetylase family protein [Myxococcota bacterium]
MRLLMGLAAVLTACNGDEVDSGDVVDDTGAVDTDEPVVVERQAGCSGLDPADRAPLGGNVALTFDDGPDPVITPQILSVLRTYQIPATFFVIGEKVDDPENAALVQEIAEDPLFLLANHSYTHPDLRRESQNSVREEVASTSDALGGFDVEPDFFRYPFGSGDCDRNDLVRDELGLIVTGWHIDTADWCFGVDEIGLCEVDDYWRMPDDYTRDMFNWTLDQIEAFDGGIVLYHDVHQNTADELEDAILAIQSRGYTFTNIDDADAFPLLNAGDFYDFPWMGESCDTTDDTCWMVEYLSYCAETNDPDAEPTAGVCVLPCLSSRDCIDRDGVADTECVQTPQGENVCLALSQPVNEQCAEVPGTVRSRLPRFNGTGTLNVCMPFDWQE